VSKVLAIETKNLTKKYDGTTVVDQLNLQVEENEVFGLLGPNGAGKTTIILMLLGLTEPTSGSVHVAGYDPVREPIKVKRIVGYLPEKVGFYNNLTASENLRFIAELNGIGIAEAEHRIDEILTLVGLQKAAGLAVGKFSRGMKQRLGIADILIKKPRIVFLDEPAGGLDPEGINQLLELITSLPAQGTTVILTSHQLHQVQRVCHRIGIISQGKMVTQGSIDELGRAAFAGGSHRLEVETEKPGSELVAAIQEINGIIKVELKDNLLVIYANSDLRADISRVVVQNNFPLIQMKIQDFSLDDIYMKYFHEG
jgi:ABC-2 type transport system ATP-binding protein